MWLIAHVELVVSLKLGVSAFCNSVMASMIFSIFFPTSVIIPGISFLMMVSSIHCAYY